MILSVTEVLATVIVEVDERARRVRARVAGNGRAIGRVHDGDELPGDLAGAGHRIEHREMCLGHPILVGVVAIEGAGDLDTNWQLPERNPGHRHEAIDDLSRD